MQRTGRKGHAMFRVVVQDARRTPTSGKVVARLGSYDPHAKTVTLDKEKASFYLEHGAQPSDRVVVLLKKEGVKLPKWVQEPTKKERAVRNADKRRSTRPEEPAEAAAAEAPAEPAAEAPAEAAPAAAAEAPAEETSEAAAESSTAQEPASDAAAETAAKESK
ncbi:MAG TPA: 30S ribosomal protein S16 [Candidatus Saccharimonadales bacterium]|nr:30S ribosomal protein S16 [Candidatus Saccharimonadales bacterium]